MSGGGRPIDLFDDLIPGRRPQQDRAGSARRVDLFDDLLPKPESEADRLTRVDAERKKSEAQLAETARSNTALANPPRKDLSYSEQLDEENKARSRRVATTLTKASAADEGLAFHVQHVEDAFQAARAKAAQNLNATVFPGHQGVAARAARVAAGMVSDPFGAAVTIAAAPVQAAAKGAEFAGQTAAEMTLQDRLRAYALDDPERISEQDAALAGVQVGLNAFLKLPKGGGAVPFLSGVTDAATAAKAGTPLVQGGAPVFQAAARAARLPQAVGSRLAGAVASGVEGATFGAAYSPDDPKVGALLGLVAGGALSEKLAAQGKPEAPFVGQQDRLFPRQPGNEATATMGEKPPAEVPPYDPAEPIATTLERYRQELAAKGIDVTLKPKPVETPVAVVEALPERGVSATEDTPPSPPAERAPVVAAASGREPVTLALPRGFTLPGKLFIDPMSQYQGQDAQQLYLGAVDRAKALTEAFAQTINIVERRDLSAQLGATLQEVRLAFGTQVQAHLAVELGYRADTFRRDVPDVPIPVDTPPSPSEIGTPGWRAPERTGDNPVVTAFEEAHGGRGAVEPSRPVDQRGYMIPQAGDKVAMAVLGGDTGRTEVRGTVIEQPKKPGQFMVQVEGGSASARRQMGLAGHAWTVEGDPQVEIARQQSVEAQRVVDERAAATREEVRLKDANRPPFTEESARARLAQQLSEFFKEKADQVRETGISDEDLKAQISQHFGIQGGYHSPGQWSHAMKGGKEPTFAFGMGNLSGKPEYARDDANVSPIVWKGPQLLKQVREAFDLPKPGQPSKAEQALIAERKAAAEKKPSKAELRPVRTEDGGIRYEAVPIQEVADEGVREVRQDEASVPRRASPEGTEGAAIERPTRGTPESTGRGSETGVSGSGGERPGRAPGERTGRGAGGDRPVRSDERDVGADAGEGAPPAAERVEDDATPTPDSAGNFRIRGDEDLGITGSAPNRALNNVTAIATLKQILEEGRAALPMEQQKLARYVGWGDTRLSRILDTGVELAPWEQKAFDALSKLVTPDELAAMRASTINAHYTSPDVIRAMWSAVERLGFAGGRVLEPSAGVGHFLGLTPNSIAFRTRFTAVELDRITGGLLKNLYPKSDIRVQGFETLQLPDGMFDLAIGNVPFGAIHLHEPRYNPLKLTIHNHFIVKSLDLVRPGGVVALITSRYTMDSVESSHRQAIQERADLIGAIRLPDDAFKQNAGTSVVTDLLFFRKRAPGEPATGEAWQELGTHDVGVDLNEYYLAHPEMMLGEPSMEGTQWASETFTLKSFKDAPFADQLAEAIARLPESVLQPAKTTTKVEFLTALREAADNPADIDVQHVREYGYFVAPDGRILQRIQGVATDPEIPKTALVRIKRMIGLRDTLTNLRARDAVGADPAETDPLRAELNRQYDAFVQAHGYINLEVRQSRTITRKTGESYTQHIVKHPNWNYFEDDPQFAAVTAGLEKYSHSSDPEIPSTARKADIFTSRTISPTRLVPTAATPEEALYQSLNNSGTVDLDWMAALLKQPPEAVLAALMEHGSIFRDPATDKYETPDKYLSGNVREKLKAAEVAVASDPSYQRNVEALQPVIPKDKPAALIKLNIAAPWVPPKILQRFVQETLGLQVTLEHNAREGVWVMSDARRYERGSSVKNSTTWATERVDGLGIMKDSLAQKHTTVYDRISDPSTASGYREVVNAEATLQAQEKQRALEEEYQKWLWSDPEQRDGLVRRYNDMMNATVAPKYDGSHLILPGTSTHIGGRPFTYHPHQKNAAYRGIVEGSMLLAHGVGTGKTYTAITIGMESKRLGFARKGAHIVPNSMLGQYSQEFLGLYQDANILIASKKDFEKSKRKAFIARVAQNNWDAVVFTHSSFNKLPMSVAFQERKIHEELQALEAEIRAAREAEGKNGQSVKLLEAAKIALQNKLAKLNANERKDRDFITFEETGIDQLFVDELHLFKNLYARTKIQRLPVANPGAGRAFDMYWKSQYLNEINPGRGFYGMTGTPISNSLIEMYTMQRYFRPEALEALGIQSVDGWFGVFGQEVPNVELAPDGSGMRMNTRFFFKNTQQLGSMFRQFADVVSGDEVFPDVPGKRSKRPPLIKRNIIVQPTMSQLAYQQYLIRRGEQVKGRKAKKGEDNILVLFTEGRTAAVEMRLLSEHAPADNALSDEAVKQVAALYHETTPLRGTQIMFADIGTPKSGKAKVKTTAEDLRENSAEDDDIAFEAAPEAAAADDDTPDVVRTNFSLYQDLKDRLIEAGVKPEEIAFIHDAKNDMLRDRMFADMNAGKVRVLIGSTGKMGVGVNVNAKLVGMTNIDFPSDMKPSSIEQRQGRGYRQNNRLWDDGLIQGVHDIRIAVERTMAANLWEMGERKQRMAEQGLYGAGDVDTLEDMDSQVEDFETMKALATGNPMMIERVTLEKEIAVLEASKRGHAEGQQSAVTQARVATFNTLPAREKNAADAADDLQAATAIDTTGDKFRITIGRKEYTDRKEAGQALAAAAKTSIRKREAGSKEEWMTIGALGDFAIQAQWEPSKSDYTMALVRKGLYRSDAELGTDGFGMIRSLETIPKRLPAVAEWARAEIGRTKDRIRELETAANAPWPRQDELTAKKERFAVVKDATTSSGPATKLEPLAPENTKAWWDLTKQGVFPYVEVAIDPPAGSPPLFDEDNPDDLGPPLLDPNLSMLGLGAFARLFQPGQRATFTPIAPAARAEIEERWMKARGIPPAERATIRQALKNVVQSFQRHYPKLDTKSDARIAASADILRRVEAVPPWAKAAAVDRVLFVTGALDAPKLDLLTRVLVLRDVARSVEEGLYDEKSLPFGYTDLGEVQGDAGRFERAAYADPDVRAALDRRAAFVKQFTAKLVEIDALPETVLKDDRYYHRQVMEYFTAKSPQYVGASTRDVRTRQKGFQKHRVGGGDFNTAYQEAEFEWVAQGFSKIAMHEAQAELKNLNDIRDDLKREAKTQNTQNVRAAITDLWNRAADGDVKAMNRLAAFNINTPVQAMNPYGQFKQRIAIATGEIYRAMVKPGTSWPGFDRMARALATEWADYQARPAAERAEEPFQFSHPDFFRFLDHQLQTKGPLAGPAGGIYKAIGDRTKFTTAVLGANEVDWRDLVPDGHVVWQPEEGSIFYRAATIEEDTLAAVLAGSESLDAKDVRHAMVMGGPKEEWVIPQALAETMDELRPPAPNEAIEAVYRQLVGAWKQWTLLNPSRAFKYNLNNQFGDSDMVFAYEPNIFTYAEQAMKDLYAQMKGKASPAVNAALLEAMRLRVVGSGMSIAEIPDISKLAAYRGISGYTPSVLTDAVESYWGTVRNYTNFRENVLRLSAFRFFEQERLAGRVRYGVSKPYEIDALQGPARSAKLAAELLIDYGDISHAGQWVRTRMIPFYSWLEGNAPRYWRLVKNAPLEEAAGGESAGAKGAKAGATLGAKVGLKLGILALRMNAFYLAVWLWNRLQHPDEQEAMRRSGQGNNLILGKREDGSIISLRVEGAFSDALKWVALNDWPQDIEELARHSATLADKAWEAAKAPVERIVQSWEPFTKGIFEISTGQSTYPHVFKPGAGAHFGTTPMRDRAEAAARTVSLDWLYREVTGRPHRPGSRLTNAALSLGTYRTDPGEASYFYTKALIGKWKQATGQSEAGGEPTDRSNALAYFKMAARWGDEAAADRWLDKYFALGGKKDGLIQSLRLSAPLGGLSAPHRAQFLQSLAPLDKAAAMDAETWWKGHDGEAQKLQGALRNYHQPRTVPVSPPDQLPRGAQVPRKPYF